MLLIDLGNTRGKLVEIDDGRLQPPIYWDYQQPIISLLEKIETQTLCVASVAPAHVLDSLLLAAKQFGLSVQHVHSEPKAHGVINGYQDYSQLGVDRWLALIGARQITKHACVVVDAGTAVTVDVLTSCGQHLGGWIVPGVTLMQSALMECSNQLSISSDNISVEGFGQNTDEAMRRGSVNMVAATVKHALDLLLKMTGEMPTVLITGGDAIALVELLPKPTKVVPELVFLGLKQYT